MDRTWNRLRIVRIGAVGVGAEHHQILGADIIHMGASGGGLPLRDDEVDGRITLPVVHLFKRHKHHGQSVDRSVSVILDLDNLLLQALRHFNLLWIRR